MTKEEFHSILQTPDDKCDGWQIHLKERWRQGNMKAVFEITGLDFFDKSFEDDLIYGESRVVVTEEMIKEMRETFEASVQEGLRRPGLMEQIGTSNTQHYKRMTHEEIQDYLNEIKL